MSARTVTLAAIAGLVLLGAGGPLLAWAVQPVLGAGGAVAVLSGWAGLLLLAAARLEGHRQLRRRVDRIERAVAAELPRISAALEAGGDEGEAPQVAERDAAMARTVGAQVDEVLARRLSEQRAALQAAVDDRVLGLHELVRELRRDAPARPGRAGEDT